MLIECGDNKMSFMDKMKFWKKDDDLPEYDLGLDDDHLNKTPDDFARDLPNDNSLSQMQGNVRDRSMYDDNVRNGGVHDDNMQSNNLRRDEFNNGQQFDAADRFNDRMGLNANDNSSQKHYMDADEMRYRQMGDSIREDINKQRSQFFSGSDHLRPQPQQNSSVDVQTLNMKLDSIRTYLDLINSKLDRLENELKRRY